MRTRLVFASFVCQSPEAHHFRSLVRQTPAGPSYQPLHRHDWLPLPLCPKCRFVGIEQSLASQLQQAPESERFLAWLSPDGERLAVPGRRDAPMPERYVRAGYIPVEGFHMADLDRFDAIRSRQTGNSAYNEFNYAESERAYREQADFDSDDMTSEI